MDTLLMKLDIKWDMLRIGLRGGSLDSAMIVLLINIPSPVYCYEPSLSGSHQCLKY